MSTHQIDIDTLPLRSALKQLAWIAQSRASDPILEHVRIDGAADGVTLTASNGDATLSVVIPGHGKGQAWFPLKTFRDVAAKISGPLRITTDANQSTLSTGKFRYNYVVDAKFGDFPKIKFGKVVAGMRVPAQVLGWGLERCTPSMGTDTERTELLGVYLTAENGDLISVGANGASLTIARMPDEVAQLGKSIDHTTFKAAIPPVSAAALVKLISPASGYAGTFDVLVVRQFEGGQLDIETDGWKLTTKVSDNFADYGRAIPRPGTLGNSVTLGTAELVGAIKRLSAGKQPNITIQVSTAGSVRLHAGEHIETLNADTIGEAFHVGVPLKQLQAAIWLADGDEISFSFGDHTAPFTFDAPEHDGDLVHVMMPVRVAAPAAETVAPDPKPARKSAQRTKPVPADIRGEFTPVH